MGLKDDIIAAKVAGMKADGLTDEDINTDEGSAIEVEAELINLEG